MSNNDVTDDISSSILERFHNLCAVLKKKEKENPIPAKQYFLDRMTSELLISLRWEQGFIPQLTVWMSSMSPSSQNKSGPPMPFNVPWP